jgi:hypothetical protein
MMLFTPDQYLTNVVIPALQHMGWTQQNLGVVIAAIPFAINSTLSTQTNRFGPYLMTSEQHWATWDNYLALDEYGQPGARSCQSTSIHG